MSAPDGVGSSQLPLLLTVQNFRNVLPPMWPGGKVGHEFAPPDTPPCGFLNELCKADKGSETFCRIGSVFWFPFFLFFLDFRFCWLIATPLRDPI